MNTPRWWGFVASLALFAAFPSLSYSQTHSSSIRDPLDFLILVSPLLVIIPMYFVPAIVARKRRHPQFTAILMLNLFGGWTVLCWIGALVWAVMAIPATGSGIASTGNLKAIQERWKILIEVDPEVARAASTARQWGEKYELELAQKYFALDDKTYLSALIGKMREKAIADGVRV